MKRIVSLRINVKEIDKARLYVGEKGTYLNATLHLDDDEDQYGNNGFISQDVTKEEREAGERGPILGNGKIRWVGEANSGSQNGAKQGGKTPKQADPVPDIDF